MIQELAFCKLRDRWCAGLECKPFVRNSGIVFSCLLCLLLLSFFCMCVCLFGLLGSLTTHKSCSVNRLVKSCQLLMNGVMNGWVQMWSTNSLVNDPTALPPGFNLPRHLWANLNHFRTGQGQCAANLARWRKIPDPSCIVAVLQNRQPRSPRRTTFFQGCLNNYSASQQAWWRTLSEITFTECQQAVTVIVHIVNDCPLPRFPGGLTTLHLAGGWACSANDKKKVHMGI